MCENRKLDVFSDIDNITCDKNAKFLCCCVQLHLPTILYLLLSTGLLRKPSFGTATCLLISIRAEPEQTGDYRKFNQKEGHCVAKRSKCLMLPVMRMLSFGTATCLLISIRVETEKT